MPASLPEPGQIVIARQRPFVVSDIQTSTLPLPSTVQQPAERQHLLRLSSVEDEGLGEELSIVWELEPGVACLEKAQLPALKDFDPPLIFDAFLDAVAWGSVSSADDKSLQAPFRSGVDLMKQYAAAEDAQCVKAWAQRWNEKATPKLLSACLKSMGSKNLFVRAHGSDFEFQLPDGPKKPSSDDVGYDAWLALRVSTRINGKQVPLPESEEWIEDVRQLVAAA